MKLGNSQQTQTRYGIFLGVASVALFCAVLTVVCMLALSPEGAAFAPVHHKTRITLAPLPSEPAETLASVSAHGGISRNPFAGLGLEARAAYVWDEQSGSVLYARNATLLWPLASLTKLMTAVIAEESLQPDSVVAISAVDLAQDGDSGLKLGDEWFYPTLRNLMLLASSNDAAHAIAAAIPAAYRDGSSMGTMTAGTSTDTGAALVEPDPVDVVVARMNAKASVIGMSQTAYRDVTGLDLSPSLSGATGTAKDMAILVEYILHAHPHLLDITRHPTASFVTLAGRSVPEKNTDVALKEIMPGLIGSKTGYTDLAGGNLAIAFNATPGHTVIIVVLGSSSTGRFTDMVKLVQATRKAVM